MARYGIAHTPELSGADVPGQKPGIVGPVIDARKAAICNNVVTRFSVRPLTVDPHSTVRIVSLFHRQNIALSTVIRPNF